MKIEFSKISQVVNYLKENISPNDIGHDKDMFRQIKHRNRKRDFDSTRMHLEEKINSDFHHLNHKSQTLRKGLGETLDEYYHIMLENGVEMEGSPGVENGTDKVLDVRIKVLNDIDRVKDMITVNRIVGEELPGSVVFNDLIIGPERYYETKGWIYLLAENFQGKKLHEAPYQIMEKHVINCARLSEIDIINEVGEFKYQRENFSGNLQESLDTLKSIGFNIRKETSDSLEEVCLFYEDNSNIACWDTWTPNQKFNEEGIIKYFDWGKTIMKLVPKTYEAVQAIFSHGNHVERLKRVAKKEYKNLEGDFDTLWEAGTLYFLTRRIHYSIKEGSENNTLKYIRLLTNEKFRNLQPGKLLQQDLGFRLYK